MLASALIEAGVDLLWLETFGTLRELESAIRGAIQAGGLHVPYAVSVTTNARGELISGEPLTKALEIAESLGALAFCINCIPVGHVNASIKALEPFPSLPLGIYANLGHAEDAQDWQGSAQLSPEEYAVHARYWFERGITIIGGCCGSKPAHIRALKALSSARDKSEGTTRGALK
jgi:S-methylmethionine-dependent homocysteine/selenocysteine methylase